VSIADVERKVLGHLLGIDDFADGETDLGRLVRMECSGCGCEPLNGLNANDGRDDRDLEAMPAFAEVLLNGRGIEPPGDLLGGR